MSWVKGLSSLRLYEHYIHARTNQPIHFFSHLAEQSMILMWLMNVSLFYPARNELTGHSWFNKVFYTTIDDNQYQINHKFNCLQTSRLNTYSSWVMKRKLFWPNFLVWSPLWYCIVLSGVDIDECNSAP